MASNGGAIHSSLSPFTVSPSTYLAANPAIYALIVSAVVVHNSRVLLIRRSPTDGFPLKWETPGGGVDPTDLTILSAVTRELLEETGLSTSRVARLLPGTVEFDAREGLWRKFFFLVEVNEAEPVVLNPEEHVDFVWASADDVRAGVCEGRDLDFAYAGTRELVLDALAGIGNGEGGEEPSI
ncbi:hypothetical protein OQA88_2516 [Cercophora sp. LCS_1]